MGSKKEEGSSATDSVTDVTDVRKKEEGSSATDSVTDVTDVRKKGEGSREEKYSAIEIASRYAQGKVWKYRAISIALFLRKLLNQCAVDKAANYSQGDRPQYRTPNAHPQTKSFH